jgi:hypothetical protein
MFFFDRPSMAPAAEKKTFDQSLQHGPVSDPNGTGCLLYICEPKYNTEFDSDPRWKCPKLDVHPSTLLTNWSTVR